MIRRVALLATLAFAASAHAPVPTRTLRLQLKNGHLEGLLRYHLPAAAAKVYAAAPDPALALIPAALAGLRIDADGAELHPKVAEAHAQTAAGGALDASFLLDAGAVASELRIAVEAGPPLSVTLLTETGVRLKLLDGPGAPIRGGLSLHPRPDLPCSIHISK